MSGQGDFFCRQDNDDISSLSRLYEQVRLLKDGYDFVSCRIGRIDKDDKEINDSWIIESNTVSSIDIKKNIKNKNFLAGGSTMWTRKVFDKIGYFDTKLMVAQDYNYWIRILEYFDIQVIEKKLYFHRKHIDSHRKFTKTYKDKNGNTVNYGKLAVQRANEFPIIKSYK